MMDFPPFGGFDPIFSVMPYIFIIGFVVVIGIFISMAVKGIAQWNKNNNSPVLTVNAKIVAKRMAVGHHTHHHGDNMASYHTSSSTTYYVTFEVKSGDRMELQVPNMEYGMLAEGDMGELTFQGTRYKAFERL